VIYRRSILTAVLLAGLAGCGSGTGSGSGAASPASPAGSATTSATSTECATPLGSARPVHPVAAGAVLQAYEMGSGPRGVLLVPELGGRGLCGWWSYATRLAGRGYRVLLFDHRCTGDSACPTTTDPNGLLDDITAADGALTADGAGRTVLMGASQGGAEVIIAAAAPPPGVAGAVVLSADELAQPLASAPYPTTALSASPRLRVPLLFAVGPDDPHVSVSDALGLLASAPKASTHLVLVPPGSGHGWDLVDGHAAEPDQSIDAFLAARLP
jgi:pimeloyl-ACP methyl ester carboxylesterase